MDREAEAETVKKVLEVEAEASEVFEARFFFFHKYFEKIKLFWTATKWKLLYWKRKRVNFKIVEAEAG